MSVHLKFNMKTLIHLSMSVLLLIGTQLFLGCEKKPIIVPPVVLQPTVELTISPTGILNYGDNCTISWTSTNANGGVFLNNQSVGTSGGITKKLFRDTTFILRGVNGTLTATNQKDVKVGDWTTSKLGLITHGPWYLWVSELQFGDNEPWYVQTLSTGQYTDYMVFTLAGKLSMYHSSGVIFGGPYDWNITGETLTNVQGIVYTIKLLDGTKIILEHDIPAPDGKHIHGRETFYHTLKP